MRPALFIVLSLLLCLVASSPARAQREGLPLEYRELIEQAVAESSAGRWMEARSLFRDAHRVYPNARTLRGIGMSSYELRDYTAAYRALSASLDEPRRALDSEQRAQVEALLHRVRDLIARYSLHHLGEGVIISVDGVRREPENDDLLILEAGRHDVSLHLEGDQSVSGVWIVRGGEQGPLPLEPPPPARSTATLAVVSSIESEGAPLEPSPEPSDERGGASLLAGRISVGAGAAAMAAGVALLVVGLNDVSKVEDASVGTEWAALQDSHERSAALTGVGLALLVAGGAASAVGIVLILRAPRESGASVEARLLPTGARVEVFW